MGWTDRFRRKPALESRAEWGSSAIPLPNEGNANTYANVDLRRADASLQKVAVWAAVTLLARLVSSLPLDTYRRRGDGPPANIGNSRFLEDPAGDGQGLPDWLSQYMMSVLLRGNVYGKQVLGPDAYPTQIVLYHPDTVDGWRDLYTGQVHWYVQGKDLGANGVWHRRAYPMPGNLLGMSPIGLHMTTIGQGMAAARFGYQFFADGAMPSGMLRNTEVAIDKKVADVAKARWMAAMHGSREVAVMGKGWEYQAIQVAPEESQFLETQKYTAAECARIYGPGVPEILGYETGGSMTYANVDQRSLHLLIYALDPWLTGLERMFTAMLPQPQFVKFNRAALLRMTTDQRYAAYQTASLIGLQTPNEQRAMEDWGPVPWGDKPWIAAQQAPPPPGQEAAGARPLIEVRTEDPWDEESAALLVALAQLDDEEGFAQRAWDAGKHPRIPKGEPGGGRFLTLVDQLKASIKGHGGGGHPFEGFSREQLRRVAKARGIELKRGEGRDSIATKLLGDLGGLKKEPKAAEKPLAKVEAHHDEAPNPFDWIGDDEGDDDSGAYAVFDWINGEADKPAGLSDEAPVEHVQPPAWLTVGLVDHEGPATAPAKVSGKKIDGKYFDTGGKTIRADTDPELLAALKSVYEYHDEKTGFYTKVDGGEAGRSGVVARLHIYDRDGNKIGTAARRLGVSRNRDDLGQFPGTNLGEPFAEHSILLLEERDPPIQGGGFGTRWLQQLEGQYREEGVQKIILHADVDIGGYAWAKQGFDFVKPEDAKFLVKRSLPSKLKLVHDEEERAAANEMMDLVRQGYHPTPIELAMLGWKPGKKRWIGKDLMLNSDWHGVKRL